MVRMVSSRVLTMKSTAPVRVISRMWIGSLSMARETAPAMLAAMERAAP
jgi:hypothetical protein